MLSVLFIAASGLHLVLVVSFSTRILLRDDLSSSARLAWFAVMISLPIIGAILYFYTGEVRLSKTLQAKHDKAFDDLKQARPSIFSAPTPAPEIPHQFSECYRFGQSINGFVPLGENRVELLPDAETLQERLIGDIDRARRSVNLLFYIWLTDNSGTAIAEALIRAARRGVKCRAAADHLGSRALIRSDLWQHMKDAGVDLQIAMPLSRWIAIIPIMRIDLRNHRKLTIIDGSIGYVGSKNAADPEFLVKAKYGPWIDIMLRVEGPVIDQMQALFASDWMLNSEVGPDDFPFAGRKQEAGCIAQFHGTGPLERHLSVSQMFCSVFETAREELVITTPYFVPDIPVLHALQAAAHRGVKVILILPEKNDSWIVKAASRAYYPSLLRAGVTIYEHGPGLLHSKIVTVDRQLTLLGSSNLDLRSFDLNFENNLLIFDPKSTGEIRARQEGYIAQSMEVSLEQIAERRIVGKLWDNVIATLGPVL